MQLLKWKMFSPNAEAYHLGGNHFVEHHGLRVHTHDYYEFFLIDSGRGLHDINGRLSPLHEGDLVLIRPSDSHTFRVTDQKGFSLINLAFPQDTFNWLKRRYFPGSKDFYGAGGRFPQVFHLNSSQKKWLGLSLEALAQAPKTRLEVERLLLNVFWELGKEQKEKQQEGLPDWLKKACRLISQKENFSEGTRAFAGLAGRSPEHVAREVKRLTGSTPTDLVNQARLDWAAAELALGKMEILRISLDCGFESLSHFYRLFKKKYGESPRQYRLKHQALIK